MSTRKKSDNGIRLSLSMIVRDEENFLSGCLDSVRGIVDEIVIVDTGSTDRTKEIALSYGARVFDWTWNGDFAAARNESLHHCRGDWILYMDADERLVKESTREFHRLLAKKHLGAVNVSITSDHAFENGIMRQTNSYPRLFRRLPGVRFEGRVHEQIGPSLVRHGQRVADSAIQILHLGYAQSVDVLKQKCKRNIELLKVQIENFPEDMYSRFQLGNSYLVLKEYDLAKTELQASIAHSTLTPSVRAAALNLLAEIEFNKGDLDAAVEHCHQSLAIAPHQQTAPWFLAHVLHAHGEHVKSVKTLEDLLGLIQSGRHQKGLEIASDLNLSESIVLRKLAQVLEHSGHSADALTRYIDCLVLDHENELALEGFLRSEQLSELNDLDAERLESMSKNGRIGPEIRFFLAKYHWRAGRKDKALTLINRLLENGGGHPDAYTCAIRWNMEEGNGVVAKRFLTEAIAVGATNLGLHKAGLDLSLKEGDIQTAFHQLEQMTLHTTADLSPLKVRLASLAERLSGVA